MLIAVLTAASLALPLQGRVRSADVRGGDDLRAIQRSGDDLRAIQRSGDDLRAIMASALRAVEAGHPDSAKLRFARRLASAPGDRAAQLGLATLARLTYRYAEADRRYAALLPHGSQPPDRVAVHAALGLGAGWFARGVLGTAGEWFERAVPWAIAAHDSSAWSEALLALASVRVRAQPAAVVMPLVDSAARIAPAGDRRLAAAIHCRRAALYVALGKEDARSEARAGAALAGAIGERRLEAGCLQVLVTDYARGTRIDSLAPTVDAIERIYTETHDLAALATALQWHGYVLYAVAKYELAKPVVRRAIAAAQQSGNLLAEAWASANLAQIAIVFHDNSTAAPLVARAVALHQRTGDGWGWAVGRHLQGQLAAGAGDVEGARAAYADALIWSRKNGRGDLALTLYTAGALLDARDGRWTTALVQLDSARALAARFNLRSSAAQVEYLTALVDMRRGRPDAAGAVFDSAIAQYSRTQRMSLYHTRALRAELAMRRGDDARAEQELTSASDDLDTWRASLADSLLRRLAFQAGGQGVEVAVPYVIGGLAARGRAPAAFALAERRRARDLRDRLAVMSGRGAAAPARSGPALRLVTADSVAAAIPDRHTAILSYVASPGVAGSTLFVVTTGGVQGYRLPSIDSLGPTIGRFAATIEAGREARALGRTLGAALLDPALRALPAEVTRLIVVPDGALYRVPFDALLLADGRHAIDRFAISFAPSASVMTELWRRPPGAGRPLRVLALGDPEFGDPARMDDAARAYRDAYATRGGLARLRASGAEARLAGSLAPGSVVRLGASASEAYLRRAPLDSFTIIHLATHAFVDDASDARTSLALAAADGEDGFLGPGDLARLRLAADLVVLSACGTANGVVVGGEGLRGLAIPLLEAGARSVLATRWSVDDATTLAFIERFYRELAAGRMAGDALREAQLARKRRGAPPSEWAAFSLTGDASVRIGVRAPARPPLATR
jgi:CHAT domain-containing protein/tetratricopeptide (TPR) repeat protein